MPIDWTKPIETTCGKKARVLCTDLHSETGHTHAVAIRRSETDELVYHFPATGITLGYQLRNVPQEIRRTVYINVYNNTAGNIGSTFETREQADIHGGPSRIACLRIEIVGREGQFDE